MSGTAGKIPNELLEHIPGHLGNQTSHNTLLDKQGGQGLNEYYHLTLEEHDYTAGVAILGVGEAEKVLTLDANLDTGNIRNLGITGDFTIGATTLDEAELAVLNDVTPGLAAAGKAAVLDNTLDISGINQLGLNYLQMKIDAVEPAHSEGLFYYSDETHNFIALNDIPDFMLNVGEETVLRGRNDTGSTILNGQVIKVVGALGDRPKIALAQSDTDANANVIGVATHDINNNADGMGTTFGLVRSVNTSAWSPGTGLYLSSSVPGALTDIAPTGDNYVIRVATVLVSNVSTGSLLVHTAVDITGRVVVNNVRVIGVADIETLHLAGVEVVSTAAELNYLAGITPGTASASKALVLDASRDLSNINNLTLTGTLDLSGNKALNFALPTLGTDGVNKDYVDSAVQGITHQRPIKSFLDFTTAEPGAPTLADRYISTVTGVSSVTAQSVTEDYIYEWNGVDWDELIPDEGWAVWDDDTDTNYVFNGVEWVKFGSTITHGNLAGLQGGIATEYFHLSQNDYNYTFGVVTLGTGQADKVLTLDSNLDTSNIRNLSITGDFITGATTLSESELAVLDGITPGTLSVSKALVVDGAGVLDTLTITDPYLLDFTNSPHDHSDTANGGVTAHSLLTTAHGSNGDVVGINDLIKNNFGFRPWYDFNGINGHIAFSDDTQYADLFKNGGAISCNIHPRSDGEANKGRIVVKNDFRFTTSDESGGFVGLLFIFPFTIASGTWFSSISTIPINETSHIIASYNASDPSNQLTLYVNGKSISVNQTVIPDGVNNLTTDTIQIGGTTSGSNTFDGYIHDLKIWNREISSTEAHDLAIDNMVRSEYKGASDVLLTSGTLIIGKNYRIIDNSGGADFTNVGAGDNNLGTEFIALGSTPASWGTGSLIASGVVLDLVSENMGIDNWFNSPDDAGDYPGAVSSNVQLMNTNHNFRAYGEAYIHNNVTVTTINTVNVWEQITGFTAGELKDVTFSSDSFTAKVKGKYQCIVALAGTSAGTNKIFEHAVSVEAAIIDKSSIPRKYATIDIGALPVSAILDLDVDDVVRLEVRNITDANNYTANDCNFEMHKV